MPLVTMKCRERWFPTEITDLAYELGAALPQLLTHNGGELYLDYGTPPAAVQVDFEKFDRMSINIPDIWILVIFTEDANRLTHDQRTEVRDRIVERIVGFLKDPVISVGRLAVRGITEATPAITVDIFWGPGHGSMLDQNGSTTLEW